MGKGGRVKATWWGKVRNVGLMLSHTYQGNTCTGAAYAVIVRVMLDREPERNVSLCLSVEDARKWANALNTMADKAERENASV
jgi:hypothetical protein